MARAARAWAARWILEFRAHRRTTGVDDGLRLLRRGGVVEPDQRPAVDVLEGSGSRGESRADRRGASRTVRRRVRALRAARRESRDDRRGSRAAAAESRACPTATARLRAASTAGRTAVAPPAAVTGAERKSLSLGKGATGGGGCGRPGRPGMAASGGAGICAGAPGGAWNRAFASRAILLAQTLWSRDTPGISHTRGTDRRPRLRARPGRPRSGWRPRSRATPGRRRPPWR